MNPGSLKDVTTINRSVRIKSITIGMIRYALMNLLGNGNEDDEENSSDVDRRGGEDEVPELAHVKSTPYG